MRKQENEQKERDRNGRAELDPVTEERQEERRTDPGSHGHLVIIGGGEDRENDKRILQRFVELSGGSAKKFVLMTAASKVPDELWTIYERAFGALGVHDIRHMHLESRADANDPDCAAIIEAADGIFMTGGDQKRLLAIIGGTEVDQAMHRALKIRGACIGGTSAGASAMSGHMLADGKAELQPEKGAVSMGAGLGFLQRVVIDQHFSQRHRIARLLTLVAQNPYLHGIGIDEDTALIIERGTGIEVVGEGAVTIIDGRHMISNIADTRAGDYPTMVDVRLHLLPAGTRYALHARARDGDKEAIQEIPAPLEDFLKIVTRRNPFHENP